MHYVGDRELGDDAHTLWPDPVNELERTARRVQKGDQETRAGDGLCLSLRFCSKGAQYCRLNPLVVRSGNHESVRL